MPFFNSDFEGLVWSLTWPPAKTPPNSCLNGPKLFGTLPDSVSSAPEIFRPLTLFLWERRGTEVKKAPFFNSDFEGTPWGVSPTEKNFNG